MNHHGGGATRTMSYDEKINDKRGGGASSKTVVGRAVQALGGKASPPMMQPRSPTTNMNFKLLSATVL